MAKMKTQPSPADDWAVTTTRFVAYLDIMGFKDLVIRTPHEYIYKMMKRIDDKKRFNESVDWLQENLHLVRTTTYSDSIMLYSKDKSHKSLDCLISTVSSLTYDLFIEGIPFKGALAYGKMTLDTTNSIFFGQPLIDAYLLSEELSFYGIVVHSSAEYEIDKLPIPKKPPFIANYLTPLKNGSCYHLTIYPIYAGPIRSDAEDVKNQSKLQSALHKLRYKTSGHLRKYIDNTETYMQAMNKLNISNQP